MCRTAVNVFSDLAGEDSVPDGVCYQGYAMNLEPDLESFLLGTGSNQCNVTNGCGAHIHAGTGCESTEEQGRHYYDDAELAIDPWLLESYYSTDNAGTAVYFGCVNRNGRHGLRRPSLYRSRRRRKSSVVWYLEHNKHL